MSFHDCLELDVDYMDMNNGYIYHIQEYNKARKLNLMTLGIRVTVDRQLVGYYDPIKKQWRE